MKNILYFGACLALISGCSNDGLKSACETERKAVTEKLSLISNNLYTFEETVKKSTWISNQAEMLEAIKNQKVDIARTEKEMSNRVKSSENERCVYRARELMENMTLISTYTEKLNTVISTINENQKEIEKQSKCKNQKDCYSILNEKLISEMSIEETKTKALVNRE